MLGIIVGVPVAFVVSLIGCAIFWRIMVPKPY